MILHERHGRLCRAEVAMCQGARTRIQVALAVLISLSVGFSQVRRTPAKGTPVRTAAPFLQHVKSYEETPYVTKVVLKSGTTVLVNEFRAQPLVSIQAYVRAGILDEPLHEAGIASLLAAMICRGMPDKVKGTLRQNVQALGGFMRCTTGYEASRFEILAPSPQWKKALGIQIDSLFNPLLDPQSLKLEAGLLEGEARAILDEPDEVASAALLELGFDQPRLNKWRTLAAGALVGLTPEKLASFHKAMYVPGRILLVISGDIASGEVLNELVKIYTRESGPASKTAAIPFAKNDMGGFGYKALEGNIPVPRLLFGFRAVPQGSTDYMPLEVLRAVLGTGEGSVLSARLRDQKKFILSGETRLNANPAFGYMTATLEVQPENIDRSEIALLTEIELLKREAPANAEMERALAQLEYEHWRRLETVSGRAGALARFELLGDWKQMDRYISELRRVKAADVRRVALKYLRLENCSLVEYLPASGEKRRLTPEVVRATLEGLLEASADEEQAKRDRETVLAVKIPEADDTFNFSEIRHPFLTASILRGPEMFVREDHTRPVIDMGIFFPGGRFAESENNYGITELLARMILRRAGGGTATQFYRQLEVYGGSVHPVVTPDYFGYHFSILSKNFEPGFSLLLELIKTPDFDQEELARQKTMQSIAILRRNNSTDHAEDLVRQILFRNSSYAASGGGTVKSLAALDPASLLNWYDTFVKNRKPVVVAVGDTKGTSLAAFFVRHFSGSRMQDAKISAEYVKPLENGESVKENWSQAQSRILIGFQAPPEDDEDALAAAVLQSYAGNQGRFTQEIRDEQGAAYGISVRYCPRLRGGSMMVVAAASPGTEEAVLKALQEEIRRLTDDPIPDRDYRAALSAAAGSFWIRCQVHLEQIEDIAMHLLAGKGIEEYQNLPARLQDVSQEDLKEAARRIFRMDKAAIVLMQGHPLPAR
jgi:zinc protease